MCSAVVSARKQYGGSGRGKEIIEAFLRNIPVQLDEARRHLYSDNANVLEYMQRRLEDSLYVLNVLLQRCVLLQINECENLLRLLISELQVMHRSYDDPNAQSRFLTENCFRCPREDTMRGRTMYSLSEHVLFAGLHRLHRKSATSM